jgi:hypothetical protein
MTNSIKLSMLPSELRAKAYANAEAQFGATWADTCIAYDFELVGSFMFSHSLEGWEFWEDANNCLAELETFLSEL